MGEIERASGDLENAAEKTEWVFFMPAKELQTFAEHLEKRDWLF